MLVMEKSIICHLFYPEIAKQLLEKLKLIEDEETKFLFNIQGNSDEHNALHRLLKKIFSNIQVITAPDKGRDIGAKLLLIDLMIQSRMTSDYTLIIHDKNSPHLENGEFWRNKLFKVIEPRYQKKIFDVFEKKEDAGIVAAANFVQNEHNEQADIFACSSNRQIKELIRSYRIKTSDYNFVAGNIFWIRTKLLLSFFKERSILQIRSELESGNVLDFNRGTYIHSWERIMSWIATSQGYKIYGI